MPLYLFPRSDSRKSQCTSLWWRRVGVFTLFLTVTSLSLLSWRVGALEKLTPTKAVSAFVRATFFQANTETVTKSGAAGATPVGGNGTTTINWTINYGLNSTLPVPNITLNDTWSNGQTLVAASVQTPGGLWSSTQPNSTALDFTNSLVAPNAKGHTQPFPRPLANSVNLSGTGDGFNPAVTSNGKILGVNHHVGNASIWCYDTNTNAPCTSYPQASGITTGTSNNTLAIGNRIYVNPDSSDSQCCGVIGTDTIYCWDTTTNSSCGQSPATGKSTTLTLASGKLFTLNQSGQLRCFDPANNLNNCAGFTPVNLGMPATGVSGSSWSNDGDDLFAVGSKLYITNWERKLTCFDVATNTTCTGWPALPAVVNTTATGTHRNNLFPRLSAGGTITGICVVGRLTDATCYNLDGSTPTEVSMGNLYNPYSVGINGNTDVYLGSRVFFPLYAFQDALGCFDWATQAPCTGAGFTDGFTASAAQPYGLGTDGVSVFSYGDSAVLKSWNPLTGASPSNRVATIATVNIDSFYCGSTPTVPATWDKVLLTDINLTAGVEFTSLLVSVIDTNTGTTVFGPTEAIGTTGVFDISSISSSIRTLRLQIDESPVATVAWDDDVPPKGSLTFKNNTPVQFCYQTTVTCASNTQNHSDTINTTLDPKSATANVSTCAPSPNLALTKSAPSPALMVGQNSTYTLTVTNNGGANATTATVKDALPVGLNLISATGAGWTCTPSSGSSPVGTITCNFSGTIAANGGTKTIALVVRPTAAQASNTVINYASVDPAGGANPPLPTTCTGADTPAGCSAPVSANVTPGVPNLAVSKSQPSPALLVGQNSVYTLTVTNNGGANVTSATVNDALPAGLTLTSATGTNWSCSPTTGPGPVTVTCIFSGGTIAAEGGTSTINLGVTLTATNLASVTNKISVDPTGGKAPPDPTTCTAANTPSVGCGAPVTTLLYATPDLKVAAGGQPLGIGIADPAVCLDPGGLVGIEAALTNPNNVPLAATFTATLPGGLTAVAGTCNANLNPGGCTIAANGGTVNWNGTLAAGQTVTIIYRARLAASVGNGAELCIDNTGSVGGAVAPLRYCFRLNCPLTNTRVSDQKAGSVLVFPYYTSTIGGTSDTRMTISNISNAASTTANQTYVHLFFIDGTTCSQADIFLCLTPNASFSFKAAEYDPGNTGYVLAVAVDRNGVPVQNNVLIGNAFVRTATLADNYGAESFWANSFAVATVSGNTATLYFDQTGYDAVPKQFSVEVQSPLDAVGQQVVTAGLSGDLTTAQLTGAAQVGTAQAFNEKELFASFQGWLAGTCQARGTIATNSPRVPNGLGSLLKTGQAGYLKFNVGSAVGLLLTPRGGAWTGIRTLHKTQTTTTTLTIPLFVPVC